MHMHVGLGVSNQCCGFNLGLEHGTGLVDWNVGMDCRTATS